MRIETVIHGEYPNYERRVIIDGKRASKDREKQVLEMVKDWTSKEAIA